MKRSLVNISGLGLILLISIFSLSSFVLSSNSEPQTYTVEIKRMKFNPATLTVNKGDKVIWVNKDFYEHDVTDEVANKWTSKPLKQNQSWSKVITKNESYFCNLHKTMKGKIIVK
ncbi:cupredoxin domain-containing protein [Flavobacteriaceae bacterium LMO-SS05]|jgi:plastocyanin